MSSHERWLQKTARELDRARLTRARLAVREARQRKRTARARARKTCARARSSFRGWLVRQRRELRERILQLKAQLRGEITRRRASVARCCGPESRKRVKERSNELIAKARAELLQLLKERKRERTWTKRDSLRPGPLKARDRKQESDHGVEANLSPDELVIFRKVGKGIKSSGRMSRLEAFQHWMHDNSADVARILAADAEQAYKRALRDEQQQRRSMGKRRSGAELKAYLSHELDAVPF